MLAAVVVVVASLRANQTMHALLALPLDSVETAVVGCVDVLERSGSMVKEPPWHCPRSAPAPFSGRAWQRWLARCSQGRDQLTGPPWHCSS